MLNRMVLGLLLAIPLATFTVAAADDPSMHDVYEAANSGKLAAAQDMIATVLKDHPTSAKAHFVAAELDARQGKAGAAREQLQTAERLAPGLPFAKPEAVRALRSQLGESAGGSAASSPVQRVAVPSSRGGLSPGLLIGLVALIGFIIWIVVRRRTAPPASAYPVNGPGYGGGYGASPGGYPPAGSAGGIGSGIAGGLASGLAVGAGVVAGEAIAHRLMGDGERERYVETPPDRGSADGNSNMGGNDFGINDSSSWDDSGSSSDSSSDDW